MKLTEKQIQTQNAILLAVHNTDDIEEAKRKEIMYGCLFTREDESNETTLFFTESVKKYEDLLNSKLGLEITAVEYSKLGKTAVKTTWQDPVVHEGDTPFFAHADIIGLHPTLERVLVALGYGWGFSHTPSERGIVSPGKQIYVPRKLLNEDGTPASLRDQSIETQKTIAKIVLDTDTD